MVGCQLRQERRYAAKAHYVMS